MRGLGLSPDEALRWLDTEFDPSRYPSFTLVAATRTASVLYSWRLDSGISQTRMDAGWSMVTSSWWRTDEVVAWRTEIFERWCADGSPDLSGVPTFNLLEVADQREWSPMMTRSLSMTRSMTQAEIVDGEPEVLLRYWRRDHERPIDPACPTAVEALRLTSV